MTLDEAKAVARIVGTADNACSNCVGGLVNELNDTFKEFIWKMKDEIKYKYVNYDDGSEATEADYHNGYAFSKSWIDVEVKPL